MSEENASTPMSDHQVDALNAARRILDEHFPAYVLVMHVESEDGQRERAATTWNGGALMARALCLDAIDDIRESRSATPADGE